MEYLQEGYTVFKMRYPCLGLDGFDRTGQSPIWAVARLFEMVRCESIYKSVFGKHSLLKKDLGISLVVVEYFVNKSWYEKTKNVNLKAQIVLSCYLVYVGKSSAHWYSTIQDADTGEEYCSSLAKLVYFDWKTRKGAKLPKWFLSDPELDFSDITDKLLQSSPGFRYFSKKMPLVFQPFMSPPAAFSNKVEIAPSFIDSSLHTNHAHYLRFSLDCAELAVRSGHIQDFHGDFALYTVQKAEMLYSKESVTGDKLDVFTWPSKDSVLKLYFLIKRTEEILFSCTLSFHPPDPVVSSKY